MQKNRRDEIINACAKLYESKSFRDITIKDIAALLTFGRSSIYNYFQTKEEIFLALLAREYDLWTQELNHVVDSHEKMTLDEIAETLARSLENRERLLKLLSMNHFDMEANSRQDRLTDFKASYGNSINAISRCLKKFCPSLSDKGVQDFIYSFLPFVYGIYPYAVVTEKQREAMKAANINYRYMTIYELAYNCTKKLLFNQEENLQCQQKSL